MTWRQQRTWLVWLGKEEVTPNQQCVYLAQVACEVARIPFLIPFSVMPEGTKQPMLRDFLLKAPEGNDRGGEERQPTPTVKPVVGDGDDNDDIPDPVTGITKAMTRQWREKLERFKWERAGAGPRPGGLKKTPDGK